MAISGGGGDAGTMKSWLRVVTCIKDNVVLILESFCKMQKTSWLMSQSASIVLFSTPVLHLYVVQRLCTYLTVSWHLSFIYCLLRECPLSVVMLRVVS